MTAVKSFKDLLQNLPRCVEEDFDSSKYENIHNYWNCLYNVDNGVSQQVFIFNTLAAKEKRCIKIKNNKRNKLFFEMYDGYGYNEDVTIEQDDQNDYFIGCLTFELIEKDGTGRVKCNTQYGLDSPMAEIFYK